MAWQHIFPMTAPPEDVLETYTKAIVQNNLYIYRTDLPYIILLDMSTPGVVTPIPITPEFLNMSAIEGIVSGRSRLVAWDDENQFYWSDTDTIGSTSLNFTPSLETRANAVPVDSMKGNVVHCVETLDGFVIYTTANIIKADFTPQDPQNLFTFREITDNVGIFSKKQVTFGEEGVHYAYTNGGLYRVDTTSRKVEPIAPDVSDYITSFKQPPRLSYHIDRFLAVSLPDEQVDFGRTARQRHFEDALRYFRDRSNLDLPANFDRTFFPEGFDFNDGFPIPCEDSIPDNCDTNVLWGATLFEFPELVLEKKTFNAAQFRTSAAATEDSLPFTLISSDAEVADIAITPRNQDFYTWTQDTLDNVRGQFGIKVFPRFSFDPMSLMLYQAYLWQATDQKNKANAAVFKDINFQVNALEHNVLGSTPGGIETLSSDVEIDEDITRNDVRSSYQCTSALQEAPGPGGELVIRFTNQRTIITENVTNKTRTTVVQRFWKEYDALPVVHNVGVEMSPGSLDGTVSDTVVDSFDITPDLATTGLGLLTGQVNDFWEDDTLFTERFFVGLDTPSIKQVNALAPENPISTLEELWSTGRTIVAQTDRCTFANIRSFVSKRAVSDVTGSNLRLERTTTKRWKFIKTSGGMGLYHKIVTVDHNVNYGSASEIEHNDILTLPGPDIPLIREVEPIPLAKITGLGNPQEVLREYYEDSIERGVSVLEIYEERGWTVEPPPPSLPFVKEQVLLASPPSGDRVNGTDNTTLFSNFFANRTVCGEPFPPIVVPNFNPAVPESDIPETEITPDIVVPETIFLTQKGQPGELFPTYSRALVFDRHLRKWGTANLNHKIFLDISPINEVVYDPILEVGVTRFTFDNFLRRLGALLDNGMIVLFDDSPDDSYIVYGKIGYNRQGRTRMAKVGVTFSENPNAAVILESSLDGRHLDPYNLVTGLATKAGFNLPANVSGKWFNIVIRGRYHINQISFDATSQGRR